MHFLILAGIHTVFIAGLHKFIVKELLLQIGLLDPDLDGIAEVVDNLGPLADNPVPVLVKFEIIRLDVTQGHHSLDLRRLGLDIHSPFGET